MKDIRRAKFEPYLRELADLMYLRDWHVELNYETPSDPNASACCYIPYGRNIASISLSESFLAANATSQRQSCVHELMHCHVETIRHTVETLLPERQYQLWVRQLEVTIDQVAFAWAVSLPYPPKGKR